LRDLLFPLDPSEPGTLQARVRRRLLQAIDGGDLVPGRALPSTRAMARRLNVARNTVLIAYQGLVDDGFLKARERSGYYVAPDATSRRAQVPAEAGDRPASPVDWTGRIGPRAITQRTIEKPADWRRAPYPFIYGQVDPQLFPLAAWRACSRDALARIAVDEWSADSLAADDPLLVEEIRTRLLPRRGVTARPDEILITVGAQHALWLIAHLLVGARTTIGLEEPGYVDARNIFSLRTRRLRPLPVDAGGLVVDERLKGLDLVFTTPSHQAPTTVTMPLERRLALLAEARARDFLVVEDDYESETNYGREPTPALKSLDRDGRVLYVGSLSKILAPGVRIGFLVAPAPLVAEARKIRRLMLRHPPTNNQRTTALFLAGGHVEVLIRRLQAAYAERWRAMDAAIARHLPNSSRPPTFGGTSFWIEGPHALDSETLAEHARAEGVILEPGAVHFMAEPAPRNVFRLGFSSIATTRIEPGIRRIAALVAALG
jgi:GntR family transcriptional regulator/MocR family aminotransferase